MRAHVALLCTPDADLFRQLAAALAAVGIDALVAADAASARSELDAHRADIALIDVAGVPGAMTLLCDASARVPTLALAATDEPWLLTEIVCDTDVSNVIAMPQDASGRVDPNEVVISVEKILRDEPFGIEKYLRSRDVTTVGAQLAGAAQRDEELDRLQRYLKQAGAARHVARSIVTAADELLTNAIYNAPTDAAGRPRYASTDRREKVVLASHEHVELRYGVDGGRFVLSVRDAFGGLTIERLRECLRRCADDGDQIEHKAGGAGLGLYMVARTARQLVINVEPGARTEVLTIWDIERGRQASSMHSLHYFTTAVPLEALAPVSCDGVVAGEIRDHESTALTLPHRVRALGTRAPTARVVVDEAYFETREMDHCEGGGGGTLPLWRQVDDFRGSGTSPE